MWSVRFHRRVRGFWPPALLILSLTIGACRFVVLPSNPADARSIGLSETISVGDANLYAEIRGEDTDAPLLLWLHGGPGGAERPLFRYFDSLLEKSFLVVYFDQRGAGNSYDAAASSRVLTVARHLLDLDQVVDHLLARFRRDKLILIGHSWGGTLGLLYAKAHASKMSELICVAFMIANLEQTKLEFDWDSAEARRRGDHDALSRLEQIGKPPYGSATSVLQLQRVTERYRGVAYQPRNRAAIVVAGILQGLVTPLEVVRIIRGNIATLSAMHIELEGLYLRDSVRSLDVPASFLLGRYGHHADAELSAHYLEALTAPRKLVYWFEQSAHDIPFDEPDLFTQTVARLLPPKPQPEPNGH